MSGRSILVVGEHNVGKTNYGIQLFGRLRVFSSRLQLKGSPENITPFETGISDLNDGRAPAHTPTSANHNLTLPLQLNGQTFTLQWPDYGGEQVSEILRTRRLSDIWSQRVEQSDAWLLFLRLGAHFNAADALARPAPKRSRGKKKEAQAVASPATTLNVTWNSNARSVELIQMLLHAKGVNLRHRIPSPPLAIALTCWDELGTPSTPREELARHLPLLHEFLTATWAPDAFEVFGLSSLGGSFDVPEVREKHRDLGPETQGFVVRPDGEPTSDLAEPIAWLLERLR